jgi:hypothetical protein
MEIKEFRLLNKNARNEIVLEKGAYLANRHEGRYTFMLFQVDEFYVERVYHKDNEAFLGFIAFWRRSSRLEPYLSQINVKGCFEDV